MKSIINLLSVLLLYILLPRYAVAGSAYAVFKISYGKVATPSEPKRDVASSQNGTVVGGVAGSAFFISGNKVITAFHVLNHGTFTPNEGYAHSRVWLVHEQQPAIEIFENDVQYDSNRDLSVIHTRKNIFEKSHVFEVAMLNEAVRELNFNSEIESQGFRANSAGPVLAFIADRVEVVSVPRLDRIVTQGRALQISPITINAEDVKMNATNSVQVGYIPVVGMSGGPITKNGKVFAFNSFKDPSQASTWGVLLQ